VTKPRPLPVRAASAVPHGMQVFERGWLSSNNILFADEGGATLIDSGYASHAEQTYALVMHAVARHAVPKLRRIINSHLHSDHCGGNALLARRTKCEVIVPEGNSYGVHHWDQRFLSFEMTGQRCDRFDFTDTVAAGDVLTLGGAEWEALAAPGHDVDSLMFHCKAERMLISGDALWEDGCGAMFPTANPKTLEEDFAAAFETFDLVDSLDVRVVIPGHGKPFVGVGAALERARSRLRRLSADPARNGRHVAKVLLKFRLLDERRLPVETVRKMFRETPAIRHANRDVGTTPTAFADRTIEDLVRVGVARRDGDWLLDV
jgi:glyoxylase-like metal-dependent hydrolase (beta-lactamase superfamily II)